MKWEYLVLEGYIDMDRLDDVGKEGWELVSVISTVDGNRVLYFKRPLKE